MSKKAKNEAPAHLVRDIGEENRNKKPRLYMEDEDNKKTSSFLQGCFTNADSSRPDNDWDICYYQWESEVLYTEDGKANINLAIEKAVIRNKLADMNSMKTMVNFLPTEEDDIYKVDLTKVLWNFTAAESDLEYQLSKHKRQALVFGSSPWLEGVKKEISTRYEPTINEEGKINGEIKTVIQSYIEGHSLDIRDVWFDPVPDWKDAQYVFWIQRGLLYEDIEALKLDPNYDAEAIDCLLDEMSTNNRSTTTNGSRPFTTLEEEQDSTKMKYDLMHFVHKKKGIYIVSDCTFQHIIRNGVSPYPHRELPITMLVDHRDLFSMYGYGECRLLRSTKYERNEIRNQILDGVRIGNTMNLLVGESVSFEGNETIGGIMNVWNVKGNSNDAKFLQSPQINSGLFNVDTMLQSDATWLTSIDVNSLAGSPTKTAFEAGLQEQTKLKGIAECVREFDFWYRDFARQRVKNIQFFMPTTTGKAILGEENMEKYRTIAIKDKAKRALYKIDKKGEPKPAGFTFDDEEDNTEFFQLTPDLIASSCDVSVETQTTTPILRDVRSHQAGELIQKIINTAQTPEGAALVKDYDLKKLLDREFTDIGFDPDEFTKEQPEGDEKEKIGAEVIADLPDVPKVVPFTPPMAPMDSMPTMGQPVGANQPTSLPAMR